MSDDEKPLDPEQAQFVAKVRRLMLIAGATTFLAVAAVIAVIGYRVFHWQGSGAGPRAGAEVTVLLPKGARVLSTAVSGDTLVVTVGVGEAMEVRTFDAATLRPVGALRFVTEP